MILNQDVNTVNQSSYIPLKTVKENIDIFNDSLCVSFNSSIKSRKFPKNLKLADITPLKGKKDIKSNYRPVSILPNFSKNFDKCILTQMSLFITIYFRNINVVSERALTRNSVFWR